MSDFKEYVQTLEDALNLALKALEAISDEMTVGERYTNAGQHLLDALQPCRNALQAAPAQEHATQFAGMGKEPTDRQRVDGFMHFMLTNCTNSELRADEERNIRFMVEVLGEWRNGAHDNYFGELHGRKLREVGGRESVEGASLVRSGGASGNAGDSDSLVAAPDQVQEDSNAS